MKMDSLIDSTEFSNEQTTIFNRINEPTTTTDSPVRTVMLDIAKSPLSTAATTTASKMVNHLNPYPYQREHLDHNKITFEIPNHRDMEHIDSIHNFNTLLKRIGNAVTTLDASQFYAGSNQPNHYQQNQQQLQQEQLLTNAEISKSVVVDLADLSGNDETIGLERFFAGADMHSIINYLWIGVVVSLVILSIIFIVFSCYFYRKFREWKKCNKHMREHLNDNIHRNNNDANPMLYANGAGLVNTSTYITQMPAGNKRTAYYDMESPPCYTIATGLPSYDEALLHNNQRHLQLDHHDHHHHQQQQQRHQNQNHKQRNYFNCAFKCMYSSTPAAIHQHGHQYQHYQLEMQQHQHQHHHHQQEGADEVETQHMDAVQHINIADEHFIRKWKKVTAASTDVVDNKMQQYCCNTDSFNVDRKNSNKKQQRVKQRGIQVSTVLLQQSPSPMPPPYDITANTILLNANDVETATPMLLPIENDDKKFHICISDEKLMSREKFFAEKMQKEHNNEAAETPNIIGGGSRTNEGREINAATHNDAEGLNAIVVA